MLLAGFRSNRVGMSQPVALETLGEGLIEIGDHTGGSGIVISARSSVRIGQHVKLGGNVRIYDHDYHCLDADIRCTPRDSQRVKTKPITIGNHAFVGANAIILKGVSIGDQAIIGAGSVVTRSVPSGEIWAGNPAERLR
jgi:acetyltransferase-like isoleucine patch superfamily enzyme